MKIRLVIFVLIIVFESKCERPDAGNANGFFSPPEYFDPYLESLRGKNIHFIVGENPGGMAPWLNDTTELDRHGRIIRKKGYGNEEQRSYNQKNFLERRRQSSDITAHYVFKYSTKGDTLIRSVREINRGSWILPKDTTSTQIAVDLFKYEKSGRLEWAYDDGAKILERYIYTNGKLTSIEFYSVKEGKNLKLTNWYNSYTYSPDGTIQKISRTCEGVEVEVSYFSNGKLDSTSGRGFSVTQDITTRRFKYTYY